MKIKLIGVLLFISVIQVSNGFAQEELTLSKALKFALENKAEAQKAKLDVENAKYQINETKAGALPQINGSGNLTYNPMIQENALTITGPDGTSQTSIIKFGQPWSAGVAAQLSQQIFNQALFTGLKAAKTTREFYQVNSQLTDEQLIEKVSNAYYEVFQSQLQLQTLDINLENTQKTENILKGNVTAGLMKKIDLDRISVAVNNLLAQKQQLINALELRENALKFAIGMDISQKITFPKETFDVKADILSEDSLLHRTEIQLMEKQIDLLKLKKKSLVAAYYPTLSFVGNLGYQAFGPNFPIFNAQTNTSLYSSLGLNLTIPVFNGGANKARINQADIAIKKAQVEMDDAKLGLNLANENARTQIKNSLLTIDANRRNVSLAKEVLTNTQNNYRNGLASLTDLLDAEKATAEAQNNLNTSLLNYKVAEIQIMKSKGNLKSLINE